jgi:hypothetical protein
MPKWPKKSGRRAYRPLTMRAAGSDMGGGWQAFMAECFAQAQPKKFGLTSAQLRDYIARTILS